ncbi:MAG TPA: hypothetical protein VFH51_09465 [Myxococcota bacterium]|nr:hypothetical protein [Myxococcota bacterium]
MTPLDAILTTSTSCLIYGAALPDGAALARLRAACGDFLDWRDLRSGGLAQAQVTIREHLRERQGAVVLLPARVGAALRAILADVLDGQLSMGAEVRPLPEGAYVIAISPEATPEPELQALFGLRVATARLAPAPRAEGVNPE